VQAASDFTNVHENKTYSKNSRDFKPLWDSTSNVTGEIHISSTTDESPFPLAFNFCLDKFLVCLLPEHTKHIQGACFAFRITDLDTTFLKP